jgi:hypothetical protein
MRNFSAVLLVVSFAFIALPVFDVREASADRDAFQRCAELYDSVGDRNRRKECMEKAQGMQSLDHAGGMTIGGGRKQYDPDRDDALRGRRDPRDSNRSRDYDRPSTGGSGGSDPSCSRKGAKICKGL